MSGPAHRQRWRGLLPWLQLCRVGTLFSPAADVVAGACLVGTPWSIELCRAAGSSVLIYAAGMVLNDHADRGDDRLHRPERPIPSGAIPAVAALASGLGLLVAGVLLAPWTAWWAGLAGLVVFYDYIARRWIGLAAPCMGVLRGANLLGGAAFAATALPAGNTPALGAATAYAVYVTAVTVLGRYEDEPRAPVRAVIGVQSVPPFAVLFTLLVLPHRWPALAIGLALALVFWRRVRRIGTAWDRAAIRASMTWLLLGTMAFTALLCLGSGRAWEGAAIALAILPARWISRSIALT